MCVVPVNVFHSLWINNKMSWTELNPLEMEYISVTIWISNTWILDSMGVRYSNVKITWLCRTFWTRDIIFSVRFSDHHLNTRPFDNRTQIYHLNTRHMVTVFGKKRFWSTIFFFFHILSISYCAFLINIWSELKLKLKLNGTVDPLIIAN